MFPALAGAQDSLRFISGTTGAASLTIKYHNGYLFTGLGATLRVYKATTPVPYQQVFEYRYKSALVDLVIRNNFLYAAANYDGMTKWDIADPEQPVQVFTIANTDDQLPMIDVSLAGDTIYLSRMKKISAYKDFGDHYDKIGDFGFVTGTARVYGSDIKNGICAYAVADAFSNQNGVYFYSSTNFSLISHYIQNYCWTENVIWGKNNNILHVLGGTNGVNGIFYSLDISDIHNPQVVFTDSLIGVPFGFAVADPLKAVNINDTIYIATTAALKPGGPLDTTFIRVYDATMTSNIHLINYLPAGLWHFDLDIHFPYCYVASEWYGIKTVDISAFSHPVDLGNTLTGGWNLGCDKSGNLLVTANEGYGFKVYDISTISSPVLVNINNDPGFCSKAKFSDDGEYIYTANGTYDGFRVYKTNTLQRTGSISQTVGTGKMQVFQNRVFIQQEVPGNYLNMIDVTDPSHPVIESKIPMTLNDMIISSSKLFIDKNDSILVIDISGNKFERIAFIALGTTEDAKSIAVYNDEVFVYITQRGLVKYHLAQNGGNYTLNESGIYSLPQGVPFVMAADSFGVYAGYKGKGLFSFDRQSLVQKSFFRGEMDFKGYAVQYGIQELVCKDNLIFLAEYMAQTSILTNDNHYIGINELSLPGKIHIFPNPVKTHSRLFIDDFKPKDQTTFQLYNYLGQLILTRSVESSPVNFDRGNLPDGLYIFRISCQSRNLHIYYKVILD